MKAQPQRAVHPPRRRGESRPMRPAPARGAVAIIVGLLAAVLIGAVGLALDGGRLYLTKTELQNGADACALAAARDMGGVLSPAAFAQAEKAGKAIAAMNKVGFQSAAIKASEVTVQFGTSLASGATWLGAGAASANAKYVRCLITKDDVPVLLMPVLKLADVATVASSAVATLAPSQTNCALPMALCVRDPAATRFGYTPGEWVPLSFKDQGTGNVHQSDYTGNFRWIDYDPGNPTPGCSGGGGKELACMMAGTGQCSLPAPKAGGCSKTGNTTEPGCVGQDGNVNSLSQAYNSRFGLYTGSYNKTNAAMDHSGYSYRNGTDGNWASGNNAFGDFRGRRLNYDRVQGAAPHKFTPNGGGYTNASPAEHQAFGADRRVVTVAVVDCGSFTGAQHAPIRAYACVFMLDPYETKAGDVISKFEFLGLSTDAGSPCATAGKIGDSTSQGPLVPGLVQ